MSVAEQGGIAGCRRITHEVACTYESLLWSKIGVFRGSKYGAATAATQISVYQKVQRRVRSLDILDRRRLRESRLALSSSNVARRRT